MKAVSIILLISSSLLDYKVNILHLGDNWIFNILLRNQIWIKCVSFSTWSKLSLSKKGLTSKTFWAQNSLYTGASKNLFDSLFQGNMNSTGIFLQISEKYVIYFVNNF